MFLSNFLVIVYFAVVHILTESIKHNQFSFYVGNTFFMCVCLQMDPSLKSQKEMYQVR